MSPSTVPPQPTPAGHPDAEVCGRWLLLARLAWVALAILTTGLYIAGIPQMYAERSRALYTSAGEVRALALTGISQSAYAAYSVAISAIFLLACLALSSLLAWHTPTSRMALLAAYALVPFGASLSGVFYTLGQQDTLLGALARVVGSLSGTFFVLLYLFPDGRFVPRWTRWAAAIALGAALVNVVIPESSVAPEIASLYTLHTLMLIVIAGVAQVYRYRRVSDTVQRQQTKWVVAGVSAVVGMYAILGSVWLGLWSLPVPTTRLAALVIVVLGWPIDLIPFLIPLSFTVAILRYRLWDIDVIIRRTVVYGALTVALVVIYFGSVALLQRALSPLLGRDNQLAIVASTLAIAALFQPLRRRIQSAIDRRFYRQKYDAQRTLATFVAALQNETDLERIGVDLLGVAHETMQPSHASLWLRPHTPSAIAPQ